MDIVNNLTKNELNLFLLANNSQFLQSYEWGEFQKSLNKNVWRFGIENNGALQAVCQLIEQPLPLTKSYFYAPRGPVFKINLPADAKKEIIKLILKEARDLTVDTKTREEIFLKIEPAVTIGEINAQELLLKKVKSVQPKNTSILDLNLDENNLLQNMHQKTRYNIRLAEKKNITARQGTINDFEIFWTLMEKTTSRDNFRPHPKNYYQQLLKFLETNTTNGFSIKLWLAELDNRPLAAALIGYFGDTATYLHGGSDYQFHNLMAPYLLHWQIIRDAKNKKYKKYDFWGIAPTKVKNEEAGWEGLTRFKLGFGGSEINYAGTFDFVYDQMWYIIYNIAKKFV